MAVGVSSSQLRQDIADILQNADLSQLSSKKVRKTLETTHSEDFSGRKKEIDDILMQLIESKQNGADTEDKKKTDASADHNSSASGAEAESDLGHLEDTSPKKKKAKTVQKVQSKSHVSSESELEDSPPKKKTKPVQKVQSKSHVSSESELEDSPPKKKTKPVQKVQSKSHVSSESELEDSPPKKKTKPVQKVQSKSHVSSESEMDDEQLARQLQEEENGGRRKTRGGGRKTAPVKVKSRSKKNLSGGAKKKGTYSQQCMLAPALAAVMGTDKMARSDIVKRMWEIVKERNLADPKNKQFMVCDAELQKVFGCKRLRTFGMMKHLSKHIFSPEEV